MLKNTRIKKNNLIKLGELSLAGATLASLSTNSNVQKSVRASGNVPKVSSDTDTQTLNTNALTRMMNKNVNSTSRVSNLQQLSVNKLESTNNLDTNWGTLNAKDWHGHVDGDYFVLDKYTGDPYHIVVPNEADLQAAGMDTQGKPVGVTSIFMNSINGTTQRVADSLSFSKTNNKKIFAIDSDWSQCNIFRSVTNLDASAFDTSSITNMKQMFDNAKIKDYSSIENWNISNVTNMEGMFIGIKSSNLNFVSNWDTSHVTNMSGMFLQAQFSNIDGLSNWNVSNVTDMSDMFNQTNITSFSALSHWNTKNVKNMHSMFQNNGCIQTLDGLQNWNTDNVTDMSGMFYRGFNTKSHVDLSSITNWNTLNVTDMKGMFFDDGLTNTVPLKNWNTSNVTDMHSMFDGNAIVRADFSKWDFRKVTAKADNEFYYTGLDSFINSAHNGIYYFGNNNKLPDWCMSPKVDGYTNRNILSNNNSSSSANYVVLTSNSKLLANPNKIHNQIQIEVNGQSKEFNTPVFINSTFDNILDNSKNIQNDVLNQSKSKYSPNDYKYLYSQIKRGNYADSTYNSSEPVDVLNAIIPIVQKKVLTIKFADSTSGKDLDSNSVTLNEPENGGTIDYNKANTVINKLQQDGYDVSNINANKPSSLISAWNDVDNLQNVTTDAYKISNNDGNITITYNISHRHVNVTHDNPKTTNDTIEGTNKHYPAGVGQSDLNETIKVPVTYYNEDKPFSQKEILKQETASFLQTRDATVDVVTGNVNYTEWQGDRIINATAPHGFLIDGNSSWLPDIPGYTQTTTGPRFANVLQVTVPNEDLLKEIERLVGKSGMPILCTGIDTPASIAVTDNHGNNLDKYAVQTHGHYGSTVSWNGTSTPDKINSIVKQMQDDGYSVDTSNLNPDQFKDTEYSDNTKNKPLTTIVGTERLVKVTHDQPKTTNDTIDGTTKKYPAGVGQDDLNKTITRTITLKDENGKPMGKDIVQTIHMHRDATVNAVTGAITYTPWTADGSFDNVDVPKIDGYTPDKSTIEKIDKPEIGKDYNTSVVYTRNDEDASITYIDDTTGQVLKSESTKPKFGDVIKFETTPSDYIKQLENKGYELVSNDYKDGVTASQNTTKNKFTVHVKHRLSKVERNKDVHEHINYNVTDANGKSANESSGSNPVLHFKQTGVKDEVTGKTDWDGNLNSQTFSSVDVTKKPGYVADIKTVPAKTVTITNGNWNKSHDINTTVNYTPAEETVKMVVKDENGNIIQTIVKHGKFGEDYDFTNDKPKIDGYTFEKASDNIKGKFDVNNKDIVLTYKKNEAKKSEKPVIPTKPSKPQRTPEDTSIFGKNIEAQKDDQGLPEMAENKSGLVAAGIGIASLVGLTGLAGAQIKKRRS